MKIQSKMHKIAGIQGHFLWLTNLQPFYVHFHWVIFAHLEVQNSICSVSVDIICFLQLKFMWGNLAVGSGDRWREVSVPFLQPGQVRTLGVSFFPFILKFSNQYELSLENSEWPDSWFPLKQWTPLCCAAYFFELNLGFFSPTLLYFCKYSTLNSIVFTEHFKTTNTI